MTERENLIREIAWDLIPVLSPDDPKNKDFIEADLSKIIAREKALLAEIATALINGNGLCNCSLCCRSESLAIIAKHGGQRDGD
jgi:hypothetical protein